MRSHQPASRDGSGPSARYSLVRRARTFLAAYESAYRDAVRSEDAHPAAWQALAQALYASAEFRYLK